MWPLNSRIDCFRALSKVEESKHPEHLHLQLEASGVVFYIFFDYGGIRKHMVIINDEERTPHYSPKDLWTRWPGTKQYQ